MRFLLLANIALCNASTHDFVDIQGRTKPPGWLEYHQDDCRQLPHILASIAPKETDPDPEQWRLSVQYEDQHLKQLIISAPRQLAKTRMPVLNLIYKSCNLKLTYEGSNLAEGESISLSLPDLEEKATTTTHFCFSWSGEGFISSYPWTVSTSQHRQGTLRLTIGPNDFIYSRLKQVAMPDFGLPRCRRAAQALEQSLDSGGTIHVERKRTDVNQVDAEPWQVASKRRGSCQTSTGVDGLEVDDSVTMKTNEWRQAVEILLHRSCFPSSQLTYECIVQRQITSAKKKLVTFYFALQSLS